MATTCTINKQDSNATGLSIAEEVCYGVLPSVGAGDPADPTWYNLEPNSYSSFGGENITETRTPIAQDRQNGKGSVVDRNATAGWNEDLTVDNLQARRLQGPFFADAHEKPATQAFNKAAIVVSSVTGATHKYNTATTAIAAGNSFNKVGYITLAKGFGVAANNGIGVVASADVDDVTLAAGLADEAGPPAGASVEVVGYEFATADAAIVKTGNQLVLNSTANVLNALGLNVSEWIYIGGDAAANADSFVNNKGYARIGTIAAGSLSLDLTTFAGASEVSTGKKIRIFFGKYIRNESTAALIKRRSYTSERTLGQGATATQAEYVSGCVANEIKVNIPTAKKLTVDIGYIGSDYSVVSGDGADVIKAGTRIPSVGADAYNATSDIYMQKVYILDASTAVPAGLFGYVLESSFTINNGVTPNKAAGVLGAFDVSTANFTVSGSLTCYFQTVAAITAIKNNADVGTFTICAKLNTGFVFDMPKVGLAGGLLNVEQNNPIKCPVTPQAAKCANGYTASFTYFPYLPTVAMG